MEQPPEFVSHGELERVSKLRLSLYGLKQPPRSWFGSLSLVIQDL